MKNIGIALAIVLGLASSSCSLSKMLKIAKQQKVQATPNPLEVHKDTVTYTLSGNLPVKLMKTKTVYTINSYYKYADGGKELPLPPIPFKAEDYPNNATQPIEVNKVFTFPYRAEYQTGTLEIEGVASKGGKSKKTERLPIATGLITTSKLVQNSYYVAYASHGYNNKEEIVPVVIPDFLFVRGKSVFVKGELESKKARDLNAFIASKNATRTVTIIGTHSPEGAERINSALSNDRAKVIEKYYRKQMKKYDYMGMADSIKFILKPIIDNWDGFKNEMANYTGISADKKTAMLAVVDGAGSFEEKQKKLEQMPSYKKVFDEVYPKLRKASTEILTVKQKKTDAEIISLARQIAKGQGSADALSFEEMMYAATLAPSYDEKMEIYAAANKKQASWEAHNNLGASYLQKAINNPSQRNELLEKATNEINLAAKINSQAAEVNVNLATLTLLNNNPYKAYSYAVKALAANPSSDVRLGVNGVKGACEIYKAAYSQAVTSTSGATATDVNLFNKGLAQLLKKDFTNALGSFTEATNQNKSFAIAFYGAAIAEASNGNADGVVNNLKKAVVIDPSLKGKALGDLEFAKFNTTEAFRNALK